MSINDFTEKIKGLRHREDIADIYSIIIIILVAITAFGLGRLSKRDTGSSPVVIQGNFDANNASQNPLDGSNSTQNSLINASANNNTQNPTGKYFVASKNGKNYYSLNCSGANRIKEGNKVFFATKAEAENAGYTKSATCKDL